MGRAYDPNPGVLPSVALGTLRGLTRARPQCAETMRDMRDMRDLRGFMRDLCVTHACSRVIPTVKR